MKPQKTYITGVTRPLLLLDIVPLLEVVRLGSGRVDVLKLGMVVDGSGMGIVGTIGGNGVVLSPPGEDPPLLLDTTTGGSVGTTTGPTPSPWMLPIIPLSTGKPAASTQISCSLPDGLGMQIAGRGQQYNPP